MTEQIEHRKIGDNIHCICGFKSSNYRGLNSHIGNIERNRRIKLASD